MSRISVASTLLVIVALPAAAQTVVTEQEYLSVLEPAHSAVIESVEDLALARASLARASQFENPEVEAVREDPPGNASQTDLMLSWQLPDAARALEIDAAEQEQRSAEARLGQTLLSLRLEMREIYAGWALAAARHERLAAQLVQVEELSRREQLRAERGEASGLEAHRLSLAANVLRAQVALARAGREEWKARARVWNSSLPENARPAIPELPPLPRQHDDHPLVVSARADLDAAIASRKAADRFIRSPSLMAGWQRLTVEGESVDGPLLGVSWSLPLFDRKQVEQAIAEARVRTARARLDRIRREIETNREAARARYVSLAESVEDLETSIAENERMFRAAEAAFLHGEANLTDFLETARAVTEAEIAMLELRGAALAALRDLERLQRPPEDSESSRLASRASRLSTDLPTDKENQP